MKFVLLVEGPTEKQVLPSFFKRWLDSKLERPIGIQVHEFEGWPELHKKTPERARDHLREPDVVGVIAIMDLYGPDFYPASKSGASERYKWAKRKIEADVGESRFRQFFAVHETEAWLLSDPGIFPDEIESAIGEKSRHPEDVNFMLPPSKLLDKLYRQHSKRRRNRYRKTTDGPRLFRKLDPETARGKCPRLKELLDEMLRMAKKAEA